MQMRKSSLCRTPKHDAVVRPELVNKISDRSPRLPGEVAWDWDYSAILTYMAYLASNTVMNHQRMNALSDVEADETNWTAGVRCRPARMLKIVYTTIFTINVSVQSHNDTQN